MAIKTTRWNPTKYLKTEEDIAEYLNAALEEAADDPAFISDALGVVARARNMMELSRKTGMSRAGLYKTLSDEGNPTFATVVKIARALGVRVTFRPAQN